LLLRSPAGPLRCTMASWFCESLRADDGAVSHVLLHLHLQATSATLNHTSLLSDLLRTVAATVDAERSALSETIRTISPTEVLLRVDVACVDKGIAKATTEELSAVARTAEGASQWLGVHVLKPPEVTRVDGIPPDLPGPYKYEQPRP